MSAGTLPSWGRYPATDQRGRDCHWREDIERQLGAIDTTLVYGQGRSYGDVCQASSGRVLRLSGLDRVLAADWQRGVLRVEAGMTLEALLALCIPRGWFPPVVPGTRQVSLGGAVANDVHGKNHHRRGTFGRHVRKLTLYRSDRGWLECSPELEQELFEATVGGLGLTGVIAEVELALMPIRSSRITCFQTRFGSLDEFAALCTDLDQTHEYTVAWLDCQSEAGRGVLSAGNHCDDGELVVAPGRGLGIPFTPPLSLVNRLSVGLMNPLLYRLQGRRRRATRDYAPFFFPLDNIRNWNRLYGPRGFQQYQCVIPAGDAPGAIAALLQQIRRHRQGSFLSVLKPCGDLRSPGLLSFPLPGISLALDFPWHPRLAALFATLDQVVAEAGGRLYPAKDAHMSADLFQAGYPAWERLETLRDPALLSRFWQRVTGVGRT